MVLGYLVIPFVQQVLESGEFTLLARIKESIRVNVLYYVALLAVGAVFTLYLAIQGFFHK